MSKNICKDLIKKIIDNEQCLLDVLTKLEPRIVAKDEICRSISCLNGLAHTDAWDKLVRSTCSYLPMNQPLYSLILNVFVPRLFSEKVFYRPPEKQWIIHQKIYEIFYELFDGIILCCDSRKIFFEKYVSKANVVIFTGRYDNAMDLRGKLSQDTLLAFNGSALNPVLIASGTNMEHAVKDIICARLYNSGQDCMAPAAIFVQKDDLLLFNKMLISGLKNVIVGPNDSDAVTIGPIIDREYFEENVKYLKENETSIIYGGESDSQALTIVPTVFLITTEDFEKYQKILFAPFFLVFPYENDSKILEYLFTQTADFYKGYISIYGSFTYETYIKERKYTILKNMTLFDHEDGNKEFGGYGRGCSFISHGKTIYSKPILLLRDVKDFFGNKILPDIRSNDKI